MENTKVPQGIPGPVGWQNLGAMVAANPGKTALYGLIALSLYSGLFFATGWLLSTLTGLPFLPLVGLVFLLRLCFT
jgi:hypothetical protein